MFVLSVYSIYIELTKNFLDKVVQKAYTKFCQLHVSIVQREKIVSLQKICCSFYPLTL